MKQEKFSIIKPRDRYVPSFAEVTRAGSEYVYYGTDNKFPQYLWGLYLKSPILSSIINGTSDFVYAGGIEWNPDLLIAKDPDYVNLEGDTLNDVIRKIITDYLIFGGYIIKVCRNAKYEIVDISWLDMQNFRLNDEETMCYYYPKGFKYPELREEYPLFDEYNPYLTSVFYYKGHISRSHYPIPKYVGALPSIETSTEIAKFHLRNIKNNFASSYIINYNNADFSEEQKSEIKQGITENFTGAENAGKFMLAFNTSKDNAVTIEKLPEDNFDKKFEALKDSTMKDIYQSFSAYPQLFGHSEENKGFSKVEFLEAAGVYYKMSCKPLQADIKRSIDTIFGKGSMSFIDINFDDINFT